MLAFSRFDDMQSDLINDGADVRFGWLIHLKEEAVLRQYHRSVERDRSPEEMIKLFYEIGVGTRRAV